VSGEGARIAASIRIRLPGEYTITKEDHAMAEAAQAAQGGAQPAPGADILDRLLGQPHTTGEPPEVTMQREALMNDVAAEIRRLRQIVGERGAIVTLAKQVRAALEAYEAAEGKAAEKAAADQKAAEAAQSPGVAPAAQQPHK
jgi:hypothetical protein